MSDRLGNLGDYFSIAIASALIVIGSVASSVAIAQGNVQLVRA
ncbi:hypothetical protein [Laspinema palackyanum]